MQKALHAYPISLVKVIICFLPIFEQVLIHFEIEQRFPCVRPFFKPRSRVKLISKENNYSLAAKDPKQQNSMLLDWTLLYSILLDSILLETTGGYGSGGYGRLRIGRLLFSDFGAGSALTALRSIIWDAYRRVV